MTSRKAAIISIIAATPFMVLGSMFWLTSVLTDKSGGIGRALTFFMSYLIFRLGSPLVQLFFLLLETLEKKVTLADVWWQLPLINILFLAQWLIWSQLLVLTVRLTLYLIDKYYVWAD